MADLDRREIAVFVPLVLLVLWMGIYPSAFLDPIEVSVGNLVERHRQAMQALATTAAAGGH